MANPRSSRTSEMMARTSDGRERDKEAVACTEAEGIHVDGMPLKEDMDIVTRKRYVDVAGIGYGRDRKAFSREEGGGMDLGMRDTLAQVCQESVSKCISGIGVDCTLPSAVIFDAFAAASQKGICIYTMGKLLKAWQLKEWATQAVGAEVIDHFIFLGRGLYFAMCCREEHAISLVQRATIRCNGVTTYVMPWDALFDPMQDALKYCPVWVTISNFPVYLRHQIHGIVNCLGKVLHVPNMEAIISTQVRVCILWDMAKPIPSYIRGDVGFKDPLCFQLSFSSFPNACYKCKQIGHFAKNCQTKFDSVAANNVILHNKEESKTETTEGIAIAINANVSEDPPSQEDESMGEHETASSDNEEEKEDAMSDEEDTKSQEQAVLKDTVTRRLEQGVEKNAVAKKDNVRDKGTTIASRGIINSRLSMHNVDDNVKESGASELRDTKPSIDLQKYPPELRKLFDPKLQKFKISASLRETRQGKRVILRTGESMALFSFLDRFNFNGDEIGFVNQE